MNSMNKRGPMAGAIIIARQGWCARARARESGKIMGERRGGEKTCARAFESAIQKFCCPLADSAGDSAQITALCYRLYPFPMDSNLRVITERQ